MGIRAVISDECGGGGGRTILVGMKMEEESRGVLTWSLMKAARPGDLVVAVHVLTQNDQSSDAAADYSLLSLVKAFDSVLSVYEGFCNLKQVELKLKICRGSSVKKVLMREAYSLVADMAVVGTSRNTMWRSSSVAKYLSRKLPKECSLLGLAVKNGKAVFQREASPRTFTGTKMSQVANEGIVTNPAYKDFRKGCSMSFCLPDASCPQLPNDPYSVDELEASSLAVAPADTLEAELKPGWPLLRRSIYFSSIAARSSFSSFKILPNEMERLEEKYSSTCKIYTYQELSAATSNFSPENVIGNGGNSLVYIGRLPNENELAVKVLKPGKDAVKEFSSELEILTNLNHKNIMPLRGFCFENTALILVYYFLSKGSVEDRLHGDLNDTAMFGWSQRYNVALGVAEAINYLHSGGAEPVIHRDVKSSNILLADDFEPKLSDFGLAEMVSTSSSYNTCSDVAGTFGYLAPEYFMYGKVNNKIDVYAFGVVLLELLSGRKPISNEYPKGQGSLVLWATPILRDGKLSQLLDPKLSSDYDHHHLIERMSLAATLCVRREPRARPHMNIILKVLQGDQDMKNWAEAEAITYDAAHEGAGPSHDLKSLLNFALLEVEDDSISMSSTHQNISLENYLQGRRSCSCSSN